jgi:hypothetical protein
MLEETDFGIESFLLLGGIYLFADYLERREQELFSDNSNYAATEAASLAWGGLISIGIILSAILAISFFVLQS